MGIEQLSIQDLNLNHQGCMLQLVISKKYGHGWLIGIEPATKTVTSNQLSSRPGRPKASSFPWMVSAR